MWHGLNDVFLKGWRTIQNAFVCFRLFERVAIRRQSRLSDAKCGHLKQNAASCPKQKEVPKAKRDHPRQNAAVRSKTRPSKAKCGRPKQNAVVWRLTAIWSNAALDPPSFDYLLSMLQRERILHNVNFGTCTVRLVQKRQNWRNTYNTY